MVLWRRSHKHRLLNPPRRGRFRIESRPDNMHVYITNSAVQQLFTQQRSMMKMASRKHRGSAGVSWCQRCPRSRWLGGLHFDERATPGGKVVGN